MVLLSGNVMIAQDRMCGNVLIEQEIKKDPVMNAKFEVFWENYVKENKEIAENIKNSANKGTAPITVPVVFHIILNNSQISELGGEQAIYERINSQILVLNEDFNAQNSDIAGVPAAFQPVIGNAEIHFEVAKIDINNNAKYGVNFLIKDPSFVGYNAHDHSTKRTVSGGLDPWDNSKYLNVWVTNIVTTSGGAGAGGQILGYGYNPELARNLGDPNLAGVVIHYLTLGRRQSVGQKFYSSSTDRGRTLTHEMGHFFKLFHIWGNSDPNNGDCIDDDGIDDTPRQEEATFNCPIGVQANCPNASHPGGKMYMNFMDYSGDRCYKMFTEGQVGRIRNELSPTGDSYGLGLNGWRGYWPTGVTEVQHFNKVVIGPNPTNGVINITFLEKKSDLNSISVYNNMGQIIKTISADKQLKNYSIDITNAPTGLYIVHLQFDEGVISEKVVVQ